MYPVCKWLEGLRLARSVAVFVCLSIVTIVGGLFCLILLWQLRMFSQDAPAIFKSLYEKLDEANKWLAYNVGITKDMQSNWIVKIGEYVAVFLQSTFHATINTIFILFLTPVYTALILYHRKIFVRYLKLVVPVKYRLLIDSVLQQIIQTYFHYIKGMLLVYILVGILNSVGLLLLGVKHAILFGMMCAFMTAIPYFGIIISALLPISVVWIDTGNAWYPLGVIAVFSIVQYIEANVIYPKIVGTQLNVSTLAMLVAIIAGGAIWGAAGMILFIPCLAILKIISDNVEEWKPVNLLLSRN
jgi:predicted PurR-regulated permease PerM